MDTIMTRMCRLLVLVVTFLTLALASDTDPCPTGMYLHTDTDPRMAHATSSCMQCTECGDNTVIRVPCRDDHDTVCGPFFEFNFFNNHEGWASQGEGLEGDPGDRGHGPMADEYPERSTISPRRSHEETETQSAENNNRDAVPTGEKWKELCFGLIGALAVVTSLALVYVFITHVRHRNGSCKTRPLDDAESSVVYYGNHSQLLDQSPSPDRDAQDAHIDAHRDAHRDAHDAHLPHLNHQLHRNQEKKHLRRIFQPSNRGGNDYVDELQDPRASATPFLLHSIPETDADHFPMAPVHKKAKQMLERTRHYCEDGPTPAPQVTEMLLNHHTCNCEAS